MASEPGWRGLHRDDVILATDMAREQQKPLTGAEMDRIADGEPYCFRCGKPASSFPEYRGRAADDGPFESEAEEHASTVAYVLREEGTYNPATNRFACDACYIAIGMPVGEPGDAYGWKAP